MEEKQNNTTTERREGLPGTSLADSLVAGEDDDTLTTAVSQQQQRQESNNNNQRRTTILGSVASLCSATLGAGVLALPFAFYQSGLVFGLVLLAVSAWATVYSIRMLVLSSHVHNERTYEALVEKVLGSRMRTLIEANIVLFSMGVTVAYLTVVGDIMVQSEICREDSRRKFMVLVWAVVLVPLSMFKTYSALQWASSVSLFSIAFLLICAFWHLLEDHLDYDTNRPETFRYAMTHFDPTLWYPSNGVVSILRACPIIIFAFSCQVNVPQVFDELPQEEEEEVRSSSSRRVNRMQVISWLATAICSFLYVWISVVGLTDFGGLVTPNILSSYDPESIMQVAFVSMALAVLMAFPINVFPARATFLGILAQWRRRKNAEDVMTPSSSDDEEEERPNPTTTDELREPLLQGGGHGRSDPRSPNNDNAKVADPEDTIRPMDDTETNTERSMVSRSKMIFCYDQQQQQQLYQDVEHVVVTLALCLTILFVALVAPNISVVFGLLGGTTASLTGFVIPGMLGIKTVHTVWEKFVCVVLIVGGSVVGVVTTIVTAYTEL